MIYVYGLYGMYQDRYCIRYIGQTMKSLESRLDGHWKGRNKNPWHSLSTWLRTLSEPPEIRMLVIVEGDRSGRDEANRIEFLGVAKITMEFGRGQMLNGIPGSAAKTKTDAQKQFARELHDEQLRSQYLLNPRPPSIVSQSSRMSRPTRRRLKDTSPNKATSPKKTYFYNDGIREWCIANGYELGYNGRIPIAGLRAYREANKR